MKTTIKPINIFFESHVTKTQGAAVLHAVYDVLKLVHMHRHIKNRNFGVWRSRDYQHQGKLKPYASVDWYVERAKAAGNRLRQADANRIINDLFVSPAQEKERHYTIMVLNTDLYTEGTNFVTGLSLQGASSVISTYRFSHLTQHQQWLCLQTLVNHEMGHMFGLIPAIRCENIEHTQHWHCANECSMNSATLIPTDMLERAGKKIDSGNIYCDTCLEHLHSWFGTRRTDDTIGQIP